MSMSRAHDPKVYAKALAEVASGPLPAEKERAIVKNFAKLLIARGDRRLAPKILVAAEKMIRAREGRRKVEIASARPLEGKLRTEAHRFVKKSDIVEEKVDSALVAGIKVTVDDERQFDASLARKLAALFADPAQS